MTLSNWFENQLRSTADGFRWATEQVPPERRYIQPPRDLGDWSAARHVFHMVYYEREVALPSMHQWLDRAAAVSDDDLDEDKAWGAHPWRHGHCALMGLASFPPAGAG